MPRLASGPSLAPITTGVAAGRPGARAPALVGCAARWSTGTGCGSRARSTPASSRASASQSSVSRVNRPVAEAMEWSTSSRSAKPHQHVLLDADPMRRPRGRTVRARSRAATSASRAATWGGRRAGALISSIARPFVARSVGLRGGAGVGPGDERGQRHAAGVESEQAVHGRAERRGRRRGRRRAAATAGPHTRHGPRRRSGPGPARRRRGAAGAGGSRCSPRRAPRRRVEGDRLGAVVPMSTPRTTSSEPFISAPFVESMRWRCSPGMMMPKVNVSGFRSPGRWP